MQQSETIGELAKALATAQGQMKNATKDAANPFFKSKYATLAEVIDTLREPLSKNGLAYTQMVDTSDSGAMFLTTTVMHSSGEYQSSSYPILPVKSDPQGVGSAISYARRYGLSAAFGLAQEDDDGNAASNPKPPKVNIPKDVKDKVLTQSMACLESGDDQGLKQIWSEFENEEKAVLWGMFNSQQRSAMKELLK